VKSDKFQIENAPPPNVSRCAVLYFELPGEENSLREALDAWRWRVFAQHFSESMRNMIKHDTCKHPCDIQDEFYNLLESSGLQLYD